MSGRQEEACSSHLAEKLSTGKRRRRTSMSHQNELDKVRLGTKAYEVCCGGDKITVFLFLFVFLQTRNQRQICVSPRWSMSARFLV